MRSDAAELSESLLCGLVADDLRTLLIELHGSTLPEDWIEAVVIAVSAMTGRLFELEAELLASDADVRELRLRLAERDAVIAERDALIRLLRGEIGGACVNG